MNFSDFSNFSTTSKGGHKRCYHTHPALPIGEHLIWGGSCISPVVTDADIYVGFDSGMNNSPAAYPWNPGHSFLFYIADGTPPKNTQEAIKLIDWLAMNLRSNQKVHLGCIGGHGRTGTILAALVNVMTGEKDAITYVRTHYCQKVVESESQVEWLKKTFGITPCKPSKSFGITTTHAASKGTKYYLPPEISDIVTGPSDVFHPNSKEHSIWGVNTI